MELDGSGRCFRRADCEIDPMAESTNTGWNRCMGQNKVGPFVVKREERREGPKENIRVRAVR